MRIIRNTFIGSLYALGVVNGARFLADCAERQLQTENYFSYSFLVLITISWPFLVTHYSSYYLSKMVEK